MPANRIFFSLFLAGLAMVATPVLAQDNGTKNQVEVPLFRHIDPAKKDLDFKAYTALRFAVTDDFPPFSYRTRNGALTGFNIAIANAVCRVLRIECLFMVKPFSHAGKSLADNEADAIIMGLRQNSQSVQEMTFTRPYFRFSARFAVRQAMPIKANDVRALAGKRLGVVIGTHHARFLKENFSTSKIREFDSTIDAQEGLRTGAVDALFDDALKLMFWIKGSSSKNCCHFVGDAYLDAESFSQPMSIAVKYDNRKLRQLLDHALDRLQISGRYNKIYRQYFPLSTWKGGDHNSGPDKSGNGSGNGDEKSKRKTKQQGAS